MKKRGRILGFTLALTMALSVVLPLNVFAAGSIKVNRPSNLSIEGQEFRAYKIFDVTIDEPHYSYTVSADFLAFLGTAGYPEKEEAFISLIEGMANDSEELNKLGEDLWSYIVANSIETPYAITAGANAESVVIDGLPLGYYLTYGTVLADNGVTITAAVSLTTTNESAVINPKADYPKIDKDVWNHNVEGEDKWDKWADLNVGDIAEFKLTSEVPLMFGYESKGYVFTVHDTMSKGLTFDAESVAVKVGGVTVSEGSDYEVVIVGTDGDGALSFKIVFDPMIFVTYTSGSAIEIYYEALLNEDAVIGAPGNPNTVHLEYSTNPYAAGEGGETGETEPETVIVYTFEIKIYKYKGDIDKESDEGLAGAKFVLRTDKDKEDSALYFIGSDGIYMLSESGAEGAGVGLESPDGGKISLIGLDAGTYYLVETDAPKGFNKIPDAITVVVVHTDAAGAFNYTVTIGSDVLPGQDTVNVLNKSGFLFPGTGDIGTTIFYIAGSVIVVAALIALVVYASKRKGSVE